MRKLKKVSNQSFSLTFLWMTLEKRIRLKVEIKISWKWVVIVSIIFGLFTTLALPEFNRYSIKMMGQLKSPDTSLFYSTKDLYEMAEVYRHSGREAYIKLRWTFDVIWPILYTPLLVLWTIKLLEYISIKKTLKF